METNEIFKILKSILKQYESHLVVVHNKSDHYYLNTAITEDNRKAEFFGSVQIKKSYVAFHLMPVYTNPELMEETSQELKKRMQGKSCFNFKTVDDQLFDELKILIERSFEKYKQFNKI